LKNVSHQLGFSLQRYYEILCVVPRHCLYALVFGVLITGLGLFVGLQISPVVGKVLAFPFVLSPSLSRRLCSGRERFCLCGPSKTHCSVGILIPKAFRSEKILCDVKSAFAFPPPRQTQSRAS
jgi:hypothetical protein